MMTSIQPNTVQQADVLIIGAGFAGLGMAIRLKQAGIHNLIILERGTEVGGTWRDNQYPGAACDIPSNLYSYSFAPNPNWSRSYSGSAEILDYVRTMVRDFQLEPQIQFQKNVTGIEFDAQQGRWHATTEQGDHYCARAAVMASGPLSNCSLPAIPGLERYAGKMIHSARWDHDYEMVGKKVAVVGTGASAVQIIPELVKQVAHLTVFQRTPGWVLPRVDLETPEWNKSLFRAVPGAQRMTRQALYGLHEAMALALIWQSPLTAVAEKVARMHLHHQVKDRWTRRQLTPDFRIGCKRVLMTNDYYPALQQPNCKLITWPIVHMTERGIRSVEGVDHQFDCVVFATGFDVGKAGTPFPVRGLNGRELGAEWQQGAQAYKSINVSGYPNLFFTFGPNSGPGHNSALVYMEAQLDYAVKGIQMILEDDLLMLDVIATVQAMHNRRMQQRLAKTNWNSGCKSWYLTDDGFNATMYPGFATQYLAQMGQFNAADYRLHAVG